MRNSISMWQIVTLSLNNCRKQRKTFRFSWLDETCSQLQPDKQLHGLQKLLVEGWNPGTPAQELGDGLHWHWHDLLHWVSRPAARRGCCALWRREAAGLKSRKLPATLTPLCFCSYCFYFSMKFTISLFLSSLLVVISVAYLVRLLLCRKPLWLHMQSQFVMNFVSHKIQNWVSISEWGVEHHINFCYVELLWNLRACLFFLCCLCSLGGNTCLKLQIAQIKAQDRKVAHICTCETAWFMNSSKMKQKPCWELSIRGG